MCTLHVFVMVNEQQRQGSRRAWSSAACFLHGALQRIVIPSGPRQPTSKAQVCLNVGVMRSLLLCWAFWSFGGRLAGAKNVVCLVKNTYFQALGIIDRIGRNLKDA